MKKRRGAVFLDGPLLVEEFAVNLQSSFTFNLDEKVQRGPIISRDNRYSAEDPGLNQLPGLHPDSYHQCL